MKKIIALCTLFFIANTVQGFVSEESAENNEDLQLSQKRQALAAEVKELMETTSELMSELSIECFQDFRRCDDYHQARRIYLNSERLSVMLNIEQRSKVIDERLHN